MSGPAHTPGPWQVVEDAEGFLSVHTTDVDGRPDDLICSTYQDGSDARLIAAAPDLLEALAGLILTYVNLDHPLIRDDDIVPFDLTVGELRQARAAIAKADGFSVPETSRERKGLSGFRPKVSAGEQSVDGGAA